MSWQQQGKHRYYYRTKRASDGRRLKIYCGRGERALEAYHDDLEARARRRNTRRHQSQLQHLDRLTHELYQAARFLVHASYYTHGWYFHHRELRRRKAIPEDLTKAATVDSARANEPVQATLEALEGGVETTSTEQRPSIDQLRELVKFASTGDLDSLPAIRQLLSDCPTVWANVYSLAKRVEFAWINTISGRDLLQREALKKQVEALRILVAGTSSDPIEGLLIDTIISSYLAFKRAELTAAEQLKAGRDCLTVAQQHTLNLNRAT